MATSQDDVSVYTLDAIDSYNIRVRRYMRRKKCTLKQAKANVTPIYALNKRQPHLEELPDMYAMVDEWANKWIERTPYNHNNITRDRRKAYVRMFERIECILINADVSDYKACDIYWMLRFRAFEKAMRAKDDGKFKMCKWFLEGSDVFGECPDKWLRCFEASQKYWKDHHHNLHRIEKRREKKLADAAKEQEE